MLRSRAIPVSFRFYIGFAVAAILGAITAALGSNDSAPIINRVIGPITIGWKGAVGDHLAYAVLLGVAVVAGFVGIVLTAFRDADATAVAEVVHADSAPLTRAPLGANYWPIVSVFAIAVLLIGLSISSQNLAIAGGIALAASALMWTLRAWAERATGDERTNVELYQQFVEPIRLPVLSIVIIGIVAIGFSRVLLALPNTKSSAAVFGVVALVFLLGAVGCRPQAPDQPVGRHPAAVRPGPGHRDRRHRRRRAGPPRVPQARDRTDRARGAGRRGRLTDVPRPETDPRWPRLGIAGAGRPCSTAARRDARCGAPCTPS